MDSEHELARAKWLLGAFAVFLVSGCIGWGEISYLISGRNAIADVTNCARLGDLLIAPDKQSVGDHARRLAATRSLRSGA